MKKHDIMEIAADLRYETDKAYLLYDGDKEAWLPKSQVENNNDGTFSMPEWLAEKVGFI